MGRFFERLRKVCGGSNLSTVLAMYAEGFSLSSVGHYLVFDSSDLSMERKELFCIYRLKRFQVDVVVRIYPNRKSIYFGFTLGSTSGVVW